jgi:hypothetical protein
MRTVHRLFRAIGIVEGARNLWIALGGSTAVTGLVTGLLFGFSQLPLWSIALIGIGLFLLGIGVFNALASLISGRLVPRSKPYHELTRVIEDGRRLRKRLAGLDADPDEDEQQRWVWRLEEWTKDAEQTVETVAPFRLAAFRSDPIIADYPGVKYGRPKHLARWEYDLEMILERLLYIRVTL